VFGQRHWEVVGFLLYDGAFVGLGFDLIEQDATGPAKSDRGAEVVDPGGGVSHFGQGVRMVAPRNVRDQLSHSV